MICLLFDIIYKAQYISELKRIKKLLKEKNELYYSFGYFNLVDAEIIAHNVSKSLKKAGYVVEYLESMSNADVADDITVKIYK